MISLRWKEREAFEFAAKIMSLEYHSDLQLHDDVDDGEEAECGEGEDGEDGADAGGDEPVRGLEVGVRAAEGVVGSVLARLERPEVARVVLARQT